jgi:periplasmic protein TonB
VTAQAQAPRPRPIEWETWALQEEADRRFRRLVLRILLPLLILGLVIPYIQMAQRERAIADETARYAELLKTPPPPKREEPKPEPEKVPEKPKLTQEQKVAQARAKASKMVSQFDQLSALREANLPKIDTPMAAAVITSKTGTGNPSFASSATAGSGGIGEIGVVEHGTARTGLGSRTGTAVRSNIGGRGEGMGKIVKGRTLEEIQLVFDRTKGAFYTMYVREQRQRPDMAGKVTVRLTIAPSGAVKKCVVIASELAHPEFENKVVARVLLMDFGAKDVGDFTIDYPILFFPS